MNCSRDTFVGVYWTPCLLIYCLECELVFFIGVATGAVLVGTISTSGAYMCK